MCVYVLVREGGVGKLYISVLLSNNKIAKLFRCLDLVSLAHGCIFNKKSFEKKFSLKDV